MRGKFQPVCAPASISFIWNLATAWPPIPINLCRMQVNKPNGDDQVFRRKNAENLTLANLNVFFPMTSVPSVRIYAASLSIEESDHRKRLLVFFCKRLLVFFRGFLGGVDHFLPC